jgi:hypothetical protein
MPFMRPATDTPFGATPYGNPLRVVKYRTDAGHAAIYRGDFVGMMADGAVDTITSATASMILGVAAHYLAAASTDGIEVYDHPEQRFMIQDDGDTTQMDALSEGTVVSTILTTGSTTTLQSAHEIDSSTAATAPTVAAGHSLKVERLAPIENDSFASAAGSPRKWIVSVLQIKHQLATSSGI